MQREQAGCPAAQAAQEARNAARLDLKDRFFEPSNWPLELFY